MPEQLFDRDPDRHDSAWLVGCREHLDDCSLDRAVAEAPRRSRDGPDGWSSLGSWCAEHSL